MTKSKIICPVCGLIGGVDDKPWTNDQVASQDICPCCGVHYGEDDWAENLMLVNIEHNKLRRRWITNGMKYKHFNDPFEPQPADYNPAQQLLNIGIDITKPGWEKLVAQFSENGEFVGTANIENED